MKTMKQLSSRLVLALGIILGAAGFVRAQDPLAGVPVFNSPTDVASWPVTTTISEVTLSPEQGISVVFDAQGRWPDFTPPGWQGPIQYTLWLVVPNVGASGFIQMWRGRPGSGAYETKSFFSDYNINWAYDGRWGALSAYHPKPGDSIGVFVTAGNARGVNGVTSARERSNVALITLPPNDRATFTFAPAAPTPTTPVATPPPPAPPAPAPLPNLSDPNVLAQLIALNAQVVACNTAIAAVDKNVSEGRADNQQFFASVKSAWAQIAEPLLKYVAPAIGGFFAAKKL